MHSYSLSPVRVATNFKGPLQKGHLPANWPAEIMSGARGGFLSATGIDFNGRAIFDFKGLARDCENREAEVGHLMPGKVGV